MGSTALTADEQRAASEKRGGRCEPILLLRGNATHSAAGGDSWVRWGGAEESGAEVGWSGAEVASWVAVDGIE